jgi:hypothetical protein
MKQLSLSVDDLVIVNTRLPRREHFGHRAGTDFLGFLFGNIKWLNPTEIAEYSLMPSHKNKIFMAARGVYYHWSMVVRRLAPVTVAEVS